jgi:3-phosphoshikimate 1-carboxyvinyltransferase
MIELRVPGDKSLTHRALMFAALARGRSRVRGVLVGEDTQSTARVLRQLGIEIPELDAKAELEIVGGGLRPFRTPQDVLDCGNSGTTTRLLMGLVAGQPVSATFTGDDSLRSRPMRRVTRPLAEMGAHVTELGDGGRLPVRIDGDQLRPFSFVSEQASAQVKSALLLAALVSGVAIDVREASASRDHTERMLRAMGAQLQEETSDDGQHVVLLEPAAELTPLDITVPGDFSSAAFLIAAALLGVLPAIRLCGVGVNPTRTGLLDVLSEMGADITLANERAEAGEPVADISAGPSELRAADAGGALIPRMIDEVPALAVLAARAEGRTTIRDASELRVKESDRIKALANNLTAIGVETEELPDGLVIEGTTQPLTGNVASRMDHRIAMAFGVLAHEKQNRIVVDDPGVVAVSFPDFWRVLKQQQS